jgi:hypothetical protein
MNVWCSAETPCSHGDTYGVINQYLFSALISIVHTAYGTGLDSVALDWKNKDPRLSSGHN